MNLKNKISKQEEQRQNHGYGEYFDGLQMRGECGGMGEEMRGLRSTNRLLHNSHRDVKYSIGNGVSEELIHMTHEHGRWCGDCLREWASAG